MQTYHRLDDIHMSAIDREHAKAQIRSAELTIDFVFAAVAKVRKMSSALRGFVISRARRIQVFHRQVAKAQFSSTSSRA